MIVSNKVDEYFNFTDKLKLLKFEEIPDDQTIIVSKYDGNTDFTGKPNFKLTTYQYIKCGFTKVDETAELTNPKIMFNEKSKEKVMNIPQLIAHAKEKTPEQIKETISQDIGKTVYWSIKQAEKNNEFVAMATLQELQQTYPFREGSSAVKLTDKDKTNSVTVTLECADSMNPMVVRVIFEKAGKLGEVVAQTEAKLVVTLKKKDAPAFIAASKAVKGVTVQDGSEPTKEKETPIRKKVN